jgi:hypothetical protein
MREIRQSGSEGGAASSRSYPYRPHGVFTAKWEFQSFFITLIGDRI